MIAFLFFGFDLSDIDRLMPAIADLLNLGHELYSAVQLHASHIFDAEGRYVDEGRMLLIPPFAAFEDHQEVVRQVSQLIPDCVVSMYATGVAAALNGHDLK